MLRTPNEEISFWLSLDEHVSLVLARFDQALTAPGPRLVARSLLPLLLILLLMTVLSVPTAATFITSQTIDDKIAITKTANLQSLKKTMEKILGQLSESSNTLLSNLKYELDQGSYIFFSFKTCYVCKYSTQFIRPCKLISDL